MNTHNYPARYVGVGYYALLQGKIQSLTEIELTKFIVIAQISLSIPNRLNLQFVVLEKYLKNT